MTLRIQRKPGESILIGPDIEIIFNKIEPTRLISVTVKAPREIKVHRREVHEMRSELCGIDK